MNLKEKLVNLGLPQELANLINVSDEKKVSEIVEALAGVGKLPTTLNDLDADNFAGLKSEITNSENARFAKKRTEWEKALEAQNVEETKEQIKDPQNKGTDKFSQILELLEKQGNELNLLKSNQKTRSLIQQRDELLQKHNVQKYDYMFEVNENTDITALTGQIEKFATDNKTASLESAKNNNGVIHRGLVNKGNDYSALESAIGELTE